MTQDGSGTTSTDARLRMVERQLRRRGIHDERVLAAMGAIPRELFVPEPEKRRAYNDSALPIGHGQTISQPWIVAAIAQALALTGSERVLDVGSGSGYSTAVAARLAREVIGIERVEELAVRSRQTLAELGIANAEIVAGDGSEGLPERSPFAGIAVHATAPGAPPALLEQLSVGGRLVVPIATDRADMLTVFRRMSEKIDPASAEGLERATLGATRFVPLIGRAGFDGID
jgi:protein-L-isoaspartate(D-aspartate) O-methyltransferase